MRRRDFFLAGCATIAWSIAARAQEAGRTYRLGGLSASPREAPYYVAMFENLRRLGLIEGQNLTVDWHAFALHADRVSDFAAELVKADVDVILASGDLATRAAQRATQSKSSATISSSVTWHVDRYARGREATAPAGNEARK